MPTSQNCTICGLPWTSQVFDQDTGETVCGRCGAVTDNPTPSVREVGVGGQNSPTPRQELGGHMGSAAGPGRDASGRAVGDAHGLRRQRRWQQRTSSRAGGTDSARAADSVIHTLADKLSLPESVRLEATAICGRARKRGLARGRTIGAVAASSVFLAIRLAGIPKSIAEVEDASNVKKIPAHYRLLCRKLNMFPPPPNLDVHVSRMASALGLPTNIPRRAMGILRLAGELGLTGGRSPAVIAAAAIALAAAGSETHNHLSMEYVARATGSSAPGVRQCAATLRPIIEGSADV